MGVSTILILLPGLLAFGISKILSRSNSRPINEIVIDLVVQTVVVFFIYYLISSWGWFHLPSVSELVVTSLRLKLDAADTEIKSAVGIFERALCASIVIALVVGIVTAVSKDLKIVARLGRRFWLFQSDANESAWKTTFESGTLECWVHVDTKGGKRYLGLGHSISWDQKDGGIGLRNVMLYDEETLKPIPVADYIYVPSDELDGPVLFVKGEKK